MDRSTAASNCAKNDRYKQRERSSHGKPVNAQCNSQNHPPSLADQTKVAVFQAAAKRFRWCNAASTANFMVRNLLNH
jgi:hypothetical protein